MGVLHRRQDKIEVSPFTAYYDAASPAVLDNDPLCRSF